MAHMYECEELVTASVNGLKKSINDANSAEVFEVARLIDGKPLKEAIFNRMLVEEEDPMRQLGGIELSLPEYQELMGAWHNRVKNLDCRFCYKTAKFCICQKK